MTEQERIYRNKEIYQRHLDGYTTQMISKEFKLQPNFVERIIKRQANAEIQSGTDHLYGFLNNAKIYNAIVSQTPIRTVTDLKKLKIKRDGVYYNGKRLRSLGTILIEELVDKLHAENLLASDENMLTSDDLLLIKKLISFLKRVNKTIRFVDKDIINTLTEHSSFEIDDLNTLRNNVINSIKSFLMQICIRNDHIQAADNFDKIWHENKLDIILESVSETSDSQQYINSTVKRISDMMNNI